MTDWASKTVPDLNRRYEEIDDRIDALECAYINERELGMVTIPFHEPEIHELKAEKIGLRNHIVFRLVGDDEAKCLMEGEKSER